MKNSLRKSLAVLLAAASTGVAGCRPSAPVAPGSAASSPAPASSGAPEPRAAARPEEKPETHATKISFGTYAKSPRAGKQEVWTIKVADARSGAPVDDFDVARGRLMHLVVVKKDLSWFNRLNPTYNGQGAFTVLSTLPEPGQYVLFADYTPRQGGHESGQHSITIGGASARARPLVPDVMRGPWMMKEATAHPEGEPSKKGGAAYKVALMPMPRALKAGAQATLHFQIRDAKGDPVKDLEPYLGARGQCSVLSADASKYLRLEALDEGPAGGPDVLFRATFAQPGLYKVWGQFLRRGQVIGAPFVLRVGPR